MKRAENPRVASGTHLVGYLRIPYSKLQQLFGEPDLDPSDRTHCEWVLDADGVVITIYDYRSGFQLPSTLRAIDFQDWHIGGHDQQAFEIMRARFGAQAISA